VVITLSNGIQVTPDARTRTAFLAKIGATDIFYPDKRIHEFCDRQGIPVVVLLGPSLQLYAETNNVFPAWLWRQSSAAVTGMSWAIRSGAELAAALICKMSKICEHALSKPLVSIWKSATMSGQ
jgi:hypothetical protein